jgi:hypothetical protein
MWDDAACFAASEGSPRSGSCRELPQERTQAARRSRSARPRDARPARRPNNLGRDGAASCALPR